METDRTGLWADTPEFCSVVTPTHRPHTEVQNSSPSSEYWVCENDYITAREPQTTLYEVFLIEKSENSPYCKRISSSFRESSLKAICRRRIQSSATDSRIPSLMVVPWPWWHPQMDSASSKRSLNSIPVSLHFDIFYLFHYHALARHCRETCVWHQATSFLLTPHGKWHVHTCAWMLLSVRNGSQLMQEWKLRIFPAVISFEFGAIHILTLTPRITNGSKFVIIVRKLRLYTDKSGPHSQDWFNADGDKISKQLVMPSIR